eukprot:GHRQ01037618.1.p1 GENE.GHRQ01037618.1~~GHRQ01037618.1.p1  ORF type:complete len:217 (+),score=70.64 GHRQ01037618.1:327-977(+)
MTGVSTLLHVEQLAGNASSSCAGASVAWQEQQLLPGLRAARCICVMAHPCRSVTAAGAVGDTVRYTAFLAALAGIYIGVDEGIAAAVGKDRSAKWRSLVAGMCAGPALLCTGPKSRHYSLATYILLRGITLLIRTGNKPRTAARYPVLHAALAPTRLAHGDTLLMCCAASQIVYAFIMMPQTLPSSYVRFIRKQGAKELYVWRGIRVCRQDPLSLA